ncbi:MAG: hypothetical protein A3I05_02640 [Deltaproteobacteria bacterium RIFCSPLOWO2_02_FULL_44_10]|nr:MAG: hypothetical protein A3C46_01590 [Deltaproteobacteria bacterium RIFCSPHIGHO2_02_FULL_44_16]OGQ45734.1 MAG: hypothetical protein A3I05_02640 [Deltaproteobacteria bacterium RIFCSPLOWO2_02_FULL_44_10]
MSQYNFEIIENSSPAFIKAIEEGLGQSTPSNITPRHYRPLLLVLRNREKKIIAGFEGSTYWGWLNIRLLWVSKDLRGKGIGEQLIKKAEEIAKERKCFSAVVDTFSFQARGFYEKLGYKIFGKLDDFPPGETRYYLSKQLT